MPKTTFVAEGSNPYNNPMVIRRLVLFSILLLPLTVHADVSSAPNGTTSVTGTSQSSGVTSQLGPSTTSNNGSNSADTSSLQPAGSNPLQSTSSDSTGLTAANANDLQEPASAATQGQLQVVLGDAEGQTHSAAPTTGTNWGWLWISLIIGLVVASLSTIFNIHPKLYRRFIRISSKKRPAH
jgi:hypothetical protein